MIIRRDIEQRTNEWLEVKRGKVSGTGVKPIFSPKQLVKPLKKGELRDLGPWRTYIYDLIAQDEHKHPLIYKEDTYLSAAVQWGKEMEPFAQKAFEKKYNMYPEEIGWLESTDKNFNGKLGCSPDGFIDKRNQIEIKCLNTANHIKCIVEDTYPKEYHPQVINYFVVNGRLQNLYFIMYDPRVKSEENRLFVKIIRRKDIQSDINDARTNLKHFFALKRSIEKQYYK